MNKTIRIKALSIAEKVLWTHSIFRLQLASMCVCQVLLLVDCRIIKRFDSLQKYSIHYHAVCV